MDQEIKRELMQLWFVSKKYFGLALAEKSKIEPTTLKWTVRNLADKCRDRSGLSENQDLIYFSAHLHSCAVRLNSIEENLKSSRWGGYQELKDEDGQRVQQEIVNNPTGYIHFLLRHSVAHSESRRKKERAFEAMYDTYLDLDFDSIFMSMSALMQSMESELRKESIEI